jgi:transcriptional regulator with XRE-family HTH domain
MQVNYNNYKQMIGAKIREERKNQRHSRESLAKSIDGVCSRTIGRIENGENSGEVCISTIDKICKELGITIVMTLGG